MTISRILIVRSPYARLIVQGRKTWELRSKATKIRGRIGIAEAGSKAVIGEVDLTGCIEGHTLFQLSEHSAKHHVEDRALMLQWPLFLGCLKML